MWPRKYLETTTFVASCDQPFGTSTSVCSKTASPCSLLMRALRDSHSTPSSGGSPARVKRRSMRSPFGPRRAFGVPPTARRLPAESFASFAGMACLPRVVSSALTSPPPLDVFRHLPAVAFRRRPPPPRRLDSRARSHGPALPPFEFAALVFRTGTPALAAMRGPRRADGREASGDERGAGTPGAPEPDSGPPSRFRLASPRRPPVSNPPGRRGDVSHPRRTSYFAGRIASTEKIQNRGLPEDPDHNPLRFLPMRPKACLPPGDDGSPLARSGAPSARNPRADGSPSG